MLIYIYLYNTTKIIEFLQKYASSAYIWYKNYSNGILGKVHS